MFLTDPLDDLADIRRNKGKIVSGTCEWLLVQPKYVSWHVDNGMQILRLTGGPGIGKTMLSSFLVKELEERAAKTPKMVLAYYFCDNKDEKRNTDTAIIRGLLLQLLRQIPSFFRHVKLVYDQHKDAMFNNFETLWRIFSKVLQDTDGSDIYILIDALDECQDKSSKKLLWAFADLLAFDKEKKTKLKLLITSRPDPEVDAEDISSKYGSQLRIDSAQINADLEKYINMKVEELSKVKKYTPGLSQLVKTTLIKKAGGTFLWVSFILKDLEATNRLKLVSEKLQRLPLDLNEVYDRILGQIDEENKTFAKLTLSWIVGARRPLRIQELKMALNLAPDSSGGGQLPSAEDLALLEDADSICRPLLYRDPKTETVNLYHQSVKDYLLSRYLQSHKHLSQFSIDPENTNFHIFKICWQYLSSKDFDYGHSIMKRFDGRLYLQSFPTSSSDVRGFLAYTVPEWKEHMLASQRIISKEYVWSRDALSLASTLRDQWLFEVSRAGHKGIVQLLLDNGADIEAMNDSGETALVGAAAGGHEAIVRLLLDKGADIEAKDDSGRTALVRAAARGHEATVRLLLDKGADIEAKNDSGETALVGAAAGGHEATVRLLLDKGADIEAKDDSGRTALVRAAAGGHEATVRLLLDKGADIEAKAQYGGTALVGAAAGGHEAIVRLLLDKGADIEAKAEYGGTALVGAAAGGHEAIVRLLLDKGADIEAKAHFEGTALAGAAVRGHEAIVRLLLDKGADIEARDHFEGTALVGAAVRGDEATVRLLLDKGADIEAKNDSGETALVGAAAGGHEATVRLLLDKGADIEAKDNSGRTALVRAAARGHEATVRLLLDKGADIEAMQQSGGTALVGAAAGGHEAIVRLLLDKGADIEAKAEYGGTALVGAAGGRARGHCAPAAGQRGRHRGQGPL